MDRGHKFILMCMLYLGDMLIYICIEYIRVNRCACCIYTIKIYVVQAGEETAAYKMKSMRACLLYEYEIAVGTGCYSQLYTSIYICNVYVHIVCVYAWFSRSFQRWRINQSTACYL